MEKPLTPEEDFLESKGLPKDCIVESDIDQDDYFQYDVADMLKEYAQIIADKKLDEFIEFCNDNYTLTIHPYIIQDYKNSRS